MRDSRINVIELLLLAGCLAVFGLIGTARLARSAAASAEAQVIGDTRAVIAAEQMYASANAGFFDDVRRLCRAGPECLGIGIPDYPVTSPEFLDPELGRASPYMKDGYQREWIAGVGVPPSSISSSASPTSVLDYCYTSTPKGWWTDGLRSFSGTATGALYPDPTGAPIACPLPAQGGCIFE